ncbi:hypothetical protein PUN28_015681 [Cardiocondyla obscurior]|uniref:Uncharacterized protein n=1 Tax=Cardiocondyla obscurior TaxID=286306 RepID=A0AAW2EU97_9HYME
MFLASQGLSYSFYCPIQAVAALHPRPSSARAALMHRDQLTTTHSISRYHVSYNGLWKLLKLILNELIFKHYSYQVPQVGKIYTCVRKRERTRKKKRKVNSTTDESLRKSLLLQIIKCKTVFFFFFFNVEEVRINNTQENEWNVRPFSHLAFYFIKSVYVSHPVLLTLYVFFKLNLKEILRGVLLEKFYLFCDFKNSLENNFLFSYATLSLFFSVVTISGCNFTSKHSSVSTCYINIFKTYITRRVRK